MGCPPGHEWRTIPAPSHLPRICRRLAGAEHSAHGATPRAPGEPELWYLKYADENGRECLVKGTRQAVRRSLREGLLGDAGHVSAARGKSGPFQQLLVLPEFRDLCIQNKTLTRTSVLPAAVKPEQEGQLPGASRKNHPSGTHGPDGCCCSSLVDRYRFGDPDVA